jgi:SAM-dependent methyltransferase
MSDGTAATTTHSADQREAYSHFGNTAAVPYLLARTAAVEAAFFLPHLRPGMSLLDVGCGPGSITLDLADVVAPGAAVGVDLDPMAVERGRAAAGERGVGNVRFEAGSIYALPFSDATFDAAFAHQVLFHLSDQGAALRELRPVLKPGGVVGIRDLDCRLWQFSPSTPLLEAILALRLRLHQHNGASPFYASQQRHLLLEAAFVRSEATAAFEGNGLGSLEKTRRLAAGHSVILRGTAATAPAQGWADEAGIDAMCAELQAWGERPDAFFSWVNFVAVGWNAE